MNIRFHINWNKWQTRISLQRLNLPHEWKRFYRLIEFKILCKRFNFCNFYQGFQVGFSFNWYCEQKLKIIKYLVSTSTSNTWMARECLGLSPAALLSVEMYVAQTVLGRCWNLCRKRILYILYRNQMVMTSYFELSC